MLQLVGKGGEHITFQSFEANRLQTSDIVKIQYGLFKDNYYVYFSLIYVHDNNIIKSLFFSQVKIAQSFYMWAELIRVVIVLIWVKDNPDASLQCSREEDTNNVSNL